MKLDLTLEEFYPHAIDRVWAALTDPREIEVWLMENDFEPRVGRKFRLNGVPMPGWRGWVDCEVLEVDPPTRMVWAWFPTDDDAQTIVTFELETVNDGTRLRLTHRGATEPVIAELLRGGWPTKLVALARVLSAQADPA